MSTLNIAAYGEGIMYPPTLEQNMFAITQAGWTSIILSLFHIDSSGDIIYNNPMIVQNGAYVGDAAWPGQVAQLKKDSPVTTILASIGGGGVSDFSNIQTIYDNNNNSFNETPLQKNFQVFRQSFPAIDLIDMDCEDNYDQPSFVAFCEMLIDIGFGITFCPYRNKGFWTGSLTAIEQDYPGAVKWWNLQCYDGGAGNDPATWAAAIQKAIPGFNTDGFILAGDWSRLWNGQYWQGDCPSQVQSLLSPFEPESCVGGAFIWTIDNMIDYAAISKQHPDPGSCGDVEMPDYVAAIADALAAIQWQKTAGVAMYDDANWEQEVYRQSGMTAETALVYANTDDRVMFFFYMNANMSLPKHGNFSPGDAVFFSGKPWLGSAPMADTYEKVISR